MAEYFAIDHEGNVIVSNLDFDESAECVIFSSGNCGYTFAKAQDSDGQPCICLQTYSNDLSAFVNSEMFISRKMNFVEAKQEIFEDLINASPYLKNCFSIVKLENFENFEQKVFDMIMACK